MKNCDIVKDLMPLAVEGLASEESQEFVKEHINHCSECKSQWEELNKFNKDEVTELNYTEIPLNKVKNKLKKEKNRINRIGILFISFVLLLTFSKLIRPMPLNFKDAFLEASLQENSTVKVMLSDKVADYKMYPVSTEEPKEYYVEAWTTGLYKLTQIKRTKTFEFNENEVSRLTYISNSLEEDFVIYGSTDSEHQYTLPRLALNYYALIALILGLIFSVIGLKFYRIRILAIFFFSYVVIHFTLTFGKGSYHIISDIITIISLSSIITGLIMSLFPKWFKIAN